LKKDNQFRGVTTRWDTTHLKVDRGECFSEKALGLASEKRVIYCPNIGEPDGGREDGSREAL